MRNQFAYRYLSNWTGVRSAAAIALLSSIGFAAEVKSAVAAPKPTATESRSAEVKSSVAAPTNQARSAPAAGPVSQNVPVMIPVAAASQRELPPEIQENLRLLTGQNSLEARQIGAQRMLRQGPAAVAALRHLLSSPSSTVVVQAIAQAMLETKDSPAELVDPLLRWLAAEEPEVRTAAIGALALCRDSDLAAKLRAAASNPQNSQVQRLAAVTVLSRLADRDAIETLVDLLDVQDDAVRAASLTALAQLTGVDFGSDVPQWRRWWQTNRNRKPQEWLAALNASLMAENRALNDKVSNLRNLLGKAYRDLYYKTGEQPTMLVQYLDNKQVPEVRLVGVDLINLRITDGKTVAPEVVEKLRSTIYDPEPQVRLAAIRILGDLRNREDARLLLEALNRETDPAASQAIARSLGRLGNPEVVEALRARLNSADPALAAASAAGLGLLCQRGNTNAIPASVQDEVITTLKKRYESATDKVLRQEMLEAMAKIADERFRDQFLAALQGPDPECRQISVKAFADLNGPEDADKILSPLLGDGEWSIRAATCGALAKIGKTRQIAQLLQRCDKQSESNDTVRRAAKDAAISIMLRLDAPALKKELDRLMELPGQDSVLVDVLESALAQLSGRTADKRVEAILLASLAGAKDGAGQKEDAAVLWVRVVTNQPDYPLAIGALAKALIELGKPDLVSSAIQQIAGGRSGALADVLGALAKEAQTARRSASDDAAMQALADTVGRIDASTWPVPSQEALKALVRTCQGDKPRVASSAPASAPAPLANHPEAQRSVIR